MNINLHGLSSSGQSDTHQKAQVLFQAVNVITPDIPVNRGKNRQMMPSLAGQYHTLKVNENIIINLN